MNFYKAIVAYDGTDYHGWQLQPNKPTITSVLTSTFKKVFNVDVLIVGASRTDAGVHAYGQVALCRTELDLEPGQLMWAWNNSLPFTVALRDLIRVGENFHPQRCVQQKTYRYYVTHVRPLPTVSRYRWYVQKQVDKKIVHDCLNIFVGTHDFRSFCTGYDMGPNTVRTIDSIDVCELDNEDGYYIEFKAHSFLRYMIRRLVGASMTVATDRHLTVDYLQMVLDACNQNTKLPTAPGKGLILQSINYIR